MHDDMAIERVQRAAPTLGHFGAAIMSRFYAEIANASGSFGAVINGRGQQPQLGTAAYMRLCAQHIDDLDKIRPVTTQRAYRYMAWNMDESHHGVAGDFLLPEIRSVLHDHLEKATLDAIEEAYYDVASCTSRVVSNLRHQSGFLAGHWAGFKKLVVTHTERESARVKSLYLAADDVGELPPFGAGQFISLCIPLPFAAQQIVRLYSLSGNPRHQGYRISVEALPGGIVSNYLHALHTGSFVLAHMPCGGKRIDHSADKHILLSEGIGIAPMLPLLRECLAEEQSSQRVLFIRNFSSDAEKIFCEELDRLNADGRLIHRLCLKRGAADHSGELDATVLREWLDQAEIDPADRVAIYLEGGPAFVRRVRQLFISLGFDSSCLHFEAFGSIWL